MIKVDKVKKSKKEHIPQTDSITELAEFWDNHDITDFEDELEEVKEPVFERNAIWRYRYAGLEYQS